MALATEAWAIHISLSGEFGVRRRTRRGRKRSNIKNEGGWRRVGGDSGGAYNDDDENERRWELGGRRDVTWSSRADFGWDVRFVSVSGLPGLQCYRHSECWLGQCLITTPVTSTIVT